VNKLSTRKRDSIMNHRDALIAEEQENNRRAAATVEEIETIIVAVKEDQAKSGN
jgi:hypothetical protein